VLPFVRNTDAVADAAWFATRPHRLFRARFGDGGTWIIHRRRQGDCPDVYLRTFLRMPVQRDTDGELARVWFATAFLGWSPEQVRKAARKAIRRDRA
jgi:hypothetical protein